MNIVLGVMLGASLGALLRWWLSTKFNHTSEHVFLGTLLANVMACFLMGLLLGYETTNGAVNYAVKIAFFTGFLGSLSTFSTFINETYTHLVLKDWLKMMLNFNIQIGLGILSFHLAKYIGRDLI